MSESQVKFIVRRAFKYGKTHYKPGQEFIPAGGKFDDLILESNLVTLDKSALKLRGRGRGREMPRKPRIGAKAHDRYVAEKMNEVNAARPRKVRKPPEEELVFEPLEGEALE